MNSETPVAPTVSDLDDALRQEIELTARIGTYRLDLQTGQAEMSANTFRLFGLEPSNRTLNLADIESMIDATDRARVAAFRQKAFAGEPVEPMEYRIRRTDGAERWLRVTARLVQLSNGERFLLGIMQDVTDETTLRLELQRRSRFAELLIDANTDRILAFDREFRLLAWNRQCELFHGIGREALLGRSFLDAFPKVRETPSAMDAIHRALDGETVLVPAQRGVIFSDRYYDLSYTPIRDESGAVEGVLCTAHDVTARLSAEETLRQLNYALERQNEALQRTNRELADFNYAATHDLTEPLRKIQTFASFIEKREGAQLSVESRNHLARVRQSAERLEVLMDGLRRLADVGQFDSSALAPVDLNALIRRVVSAFEAEIVGRHAVVEADPLPVVPGHAEHLYQLFVQLLDNALKFQPQHQVPRIRFETHVVAPAEAREQGLLPEKTYCRIDVTDNGIGFEPQYAGQIFQLFQRLHDRTAFDGAGVGLTICKKVAENHGGAITATASPDHGARFALYLPII